MNMQEISLCPSLLQAVRPRRIVNGLLLCAENVAELLVGVGVSKRCRACFLEGGIRF